MPCDRDCLLLGVHIRNRAVELQKVSCSGFGGILLILGIRAEGQKCGHGNHQECLHEHFNTPVDLKLRRRIA